MITPILIKNLFMYILYHRKFGAIVDYSQFCFQSVAHIK